MHTHRLWCLLVLLTATTAFAQPKITVDHQQPTVKTRMFDPRDPPADMPPLTGGEAAFCSYNIGAATSVAYSIRTSSDGRTCQTAWTEINLTLTCDIVIWLPHDFTPELKAHEQAHRRIAERVYDQSKPLARKLVRDLAATKLTTDPARCRESAEESANRASNAVANEWLKITGSRAGGVNDVFDKITDHGRNDTSNEEAIRRAFRKFDHPERE